MSGFGDSEMDITPAETARRMNEEGMVLIDVREPYEWDAGHVPDSTHIEMERIASRVGEVPAGKPVAFLCLAGGRSGMVEGSRLRGLQRRRWVQGLVRCRPSHRARRCGGGPALTGCSGE